MHAIWTVTHTGLANPEAYRALSIDLYWYGIFMILCYRSSLLVNPVCMLRSLSDSSRNAPWDFPVCALIWESSTKGSWNSALAVPAKPGSPVEGRPLKFNSSEQGVFLQLIQICMCWQRSLGLKHPFLAFSTFQISPLREALTDHRIWTPSSLQAHTLSVILSVIHCVILIGKTKQW